MAERMSPDERDKDEHDTDKQEKPAQSANGPMRIGFARNGLVRFGLVFFAALIVGGLVAFGVYALQGNNGDQLAKAISPSSQGTTQANSCTLNETLRARLNENAKGDMAAFTPLDRGYSMSDARFQTKDGKWTTIADWSGRAVLVNLWATWCAPCRHEMPALQNLQRALGGPTFEVLPISLDLGTLEKPIEFYAETNLTDLGLYHDASMKTLSTLKRAGLAFGVPATLLLDGKGCVLGTLNGPAEWAGEDAQNLIKAALQATKLPAGGT
ncbi:MAG: TlpA disulfide reductase family protein [Pseudomonadota bacterium]